ncbi:uncharacterized protein PITG_12526 [Phytophthora infestans T30-4]|uniref:PH domain-containing protein n=2 Tax=Phytophthora infestans TaxID=4787 RepID=D0NKR2_PHYIT|nr:uncharacterized protein PITG_12526 [Phytophthora infestans T30-4]KAF4041612.1 Pleckstrin homology domain-containing protein [Phytophthora infestans]EEY60198.1 conserved hypothetical protein [Phytophthora infestans T30-4]KAF4146756.1 PH domain-containing protein [Phytophthora infestans]KAI9988986.1 hypothetical protein PInf_022707 [Phytophthora infestans]KAI9989055.1 hypothetical protein PInf_022781 [Phytophthora infestans]|eukprot:XP_002900405.1 conserved hypothetical protein [Phytophthora infestans T30-4]
MSDGQILRTGVLFKKGSGTGPFGRKNWKPRYFVLTPSRLQYFTFEDGELKGELSLQGCDEGVLEVMPADSMKTGSSASTIWRIAINAPERRLLVAAGTEMEMNDWVDKLVMAFRINSGQPPMQRASMPAPSSNSSVAGSNVNSNPNIRDFQNFSVPRRGVNQRHSTGAEMRATVEEKELLAAQAESMKMQQLEEQREAEQDAEMRRQLAAQQQLEQDEAAQAAALAAVEKLQLQEEHEKQAQKERESQMQQEIEMRQAMELQRAREAEEAARIQHEEEQEIIRNKQLADELAMQEKLKPQQGEDLLELQRRQKREEHARQRAEREKAVKLQMQQEQEQEQEDLAFRMTQQMNSHFSVDDDSDDSDHEPESSPMAPVDSGASNGERLSAGQAPATAPRSSLVGDVKREMIQKQQQEHQRRREAALKQEQQTRVVNVREAPREVEVAPREIEVVRRAPVKKPAAPPAGPMESFEF